LRHTRAEQIYILLVVLVSMGFYYLALNLPKDIVNEAIQGNSFPQPDSTISVLTIDFTLPDWLGGVGVHLFDGIAVERVPYLLILSFTFLGLVVVNNGFKFYINTYKGRLGERMLRRLRYELFDRILRFPLPHFRRVKAAEMATMIKDEVEPLGGFIGDSFVTPTLLGGQAITAMAFIMVQSWVLGSVALVIVLFQVWLVPKLRKPVLRLGRQRQLTARELAGRIAETVDGVREIHVAGTLDYERASIADRLGRIFEIRFELYQKKFLAKLVNNFMAQLTPFVFYAVGGYFAIIGRLDIGALVAVIAAYKDLPGPLKELIDWDQQRQDVQIKYEQVIDQFQSATSPEFDAGVLALPDSLLGGEINAGGVGYADDSGVKLLDGATFRAPVAERIAVVGPSAGGKQTLALALAGLLKPTSGSLSIAGIDMAKVANDQAARHIAFVGPETYLFPMTLYDNLLYGLWRVPDRESEANGDDAHRRRWRVDEARRTGNVTYDVRADWVDYAAAGVNGPDELTARVLAAIDLVELTQDAYEMGLRAVIDPARHQALMAGILPLRQAVAAKLNEPANEGLVEQFHADAYNGNATVGENLIFGVPVGKVFSLEGLAENAYMREVLDKVGLSGQLIEIGLATSQTMVELFADLPPGHEFFERYSFIRYDDLPFYKQLITRAGKTGLDSLSSAETAALVSLAFKLLPSHRLAGLDDAFQAKVLEARRVFRQDLPQDLADDIDFFDAGEYTAAATVLDNILFGRIDQGRADATTRVLALVRALIDEAGLWPAVVRAGLDFHVGVGGNRLSSGQRQKVALARALLRRPELLVIDQATATLDSGSQKRIMDKILGRNEPGGVIWVLHRVAPAQQFALILLLDKGRVVEQGTWADLAVDGTEFHKLLQAD
jgi:putative ABC transport system ATP-binding protein